MAGVVSRAVLALLLFVPAASAQTPEVLYWKAKIQRAEDLLQQGRGEEAARDLEQSCREAEAALGPDHIWLGDLLTSLGIVHQRLGHYDQAERALLRGRAILEHGLGPDHPNVALSAFQLGSVYNSQGRFADAAPLWQRALAIWEKAGGQHEIDVAFVLGNLAELHRATGRLSQAEALQRRSLAISEKLRGPKHRDVVLGLNNLAFLCRVQGKHAEAETLFRRALDAAPRSQGKEDSLEGEILENLAGLYDELGRYAEAEPLFLRAIELLGRSYGEGPELARALSNLAVLYNNLGRYADAEPLSRRALVLFEKAFGPEHPNVASVLAVLADVVRALGRREEAYVLLHRALAIKEKALGVEHPEVALALGKLGVLQFELGRFTEAQQLFKRELEMDTNVLAATHPHLALPLANLASLDLALGRYDQAEARGRRALKILEAAYGPSHPDVARQIGNLGELARMRGRHTEAESLDEQALAILIKTLGPEHPAVGIQLNNLGHVLALQGKYAAAESTYRRAFAIFEKAKGPADREFALVLNNLGQLYQLMGRFADADAHLDRSLRIEEKILGPDHPQVASTVGNVAWLRTVEGRYPEAEVGHRRALAIREKALGMDHPEVAIALNNLAELFRTHGRPRDAEPLLERALAIQEKAYGRDHPELAKALNSLFLARAEQSRGLEAEPLLRRALPMQERTLGPEHADVAGTLNNLAQLLVAQGRLDEGEALYARALAILEKAMLGHPDIGLALNNLASVLQARGRYEDAERLFGRALQVSEQALGPANPRVALVSVNLGVLNYARDRPSQALAFSDRGMDIVRALLQRSFGYMSEKERLAFLDSVSGQFPVYLSLCFTHRDRIPGLVGKMYDFALWNKGFVVGGVAALRSQVEASGDAEALALLGQLTATRTQLATLLSAPPADRTEWRAIVERLESEANGIEKEVARRSATFAEQARVQQATWKDVHQALRPGEAAVEFLRFPFFDGKRFTGARYVALVLTPQGDGPTLVDLGEAEALETRAFSSYATQVRSRAVVHEAAPQGISFHAVLWRPLQAALAGSHRVYLSPDGKLNSVSWGAVPDDAGRLLIEDLDLRVVSSTRDLLRPAKAGSGTAAVLVGNPDFDLDAPPSDAQGPAQPVAGAGMRSRDVHMRARALPATGIEVQSLLSSLNAHGWTSAAHTGAKALEGTVKRVRGPRVLHLATHGFFMPDQERSLTAVGLSDRPSGAEDPMLRSGLLFAGANRALSGAPTPPEREDGVLTAYEAAGLNLQGTELVVLSACETGLGEVRNGEGVFGLRRAFEVAGAQNVLMSLWAVPDRETQELMGLFYEKWLSGREKHEALREAQLEMRQRVRSRYGRDLPYYWAAFVLVGR